MHSDATAPALHIQECFLSAPALVRDGGHGSEDFPFL